MSDYIKREDVMELLDMLLEHYHDTGIEVIKQNVARANVTRWMMTLK